MRGGYRYCANVGCTEYNKRFGGKVVRQKKEEEEVNLKKLDTNSL